jgi:hypothetical protein
MNSMTTFRIFVSYSSLNLDKANQIRSMLRGTPVEVFVADDSVAPGEKLPEKIEAAIRECDLFVLLWSEDAEKSKWVPIELGLAQGLEKPLLPILLSANTPLPPFFRDLKYIDAVANPDAFIQARSHIMSLIQKRFPNIAEQKQVSKQTTGEDLFGALLLVGLGIFLVWAFTKSK